jgi:hypothetical protein
MKAAQWLMRRLGLRPTRGRARFYDAMPPKLARDLAIKSNEQYQNLFSRYLRGEFPRRANGAFEQWLLEMGKSLQKWESDFLPGRNGRPSQQGKLLEQIPELLAQGLTDEKAAAKARATQRTYQRAKKKYRETHIHIHNGFGGKDDD